MPSLRTSNKGSNASSTTQAVSVPGAQEGDWIVAFLILDSAALVTVQPTGWASVRAQNVGNNNFYALWGKAGAGETSWSFTISAATVGNWVAGAFQNCHVTRAIANFRPKTGNANSTTATAPGTYSYAANSLLVRGWACNSVNAMGDPATGTVHQEQNGAVRSCQIASENLASEGLCGDSSITITSSAWSAFTVILHPDTEAETIDRKWLATPLVESGVNNHHSTSDDSPIDSAGGGTGFNYGNSTPVPRYALMDSNFIIPRASFVTTIPSSLPDAARGDCIVVGPLSKTLPAGKPWHFLWHGKGTAASAGAHSIRVRFFRSASATGSSPTQIGSDVVSDQVTWPAAQTNGDTHLSAILTPASDVVFANEYLLIQIIWQTVTAGTATGHNTNMRTSTTSLTLPPIASGTPPAAEGIDLVGMVGIRGEA